MLTQENLISLLIVSFFGALGGIAHKLTETKEEKETYKNSILNYIIVGIVASIAVLAIIPNTSQLRLIAFSVVAGYGGKVILNAMQSKLQMMITNAKIDSANKALDEIKKQTKNPPGINMLEMADSHGITKSNLEIENQIKSFTEKIDVVKNILK
jgi:hypothetical protein